MNDEKQDNVETSNMLLDVDKFSGESTGSMAPALWFFGLAGVPLLLFLYFLLGVLPIKIFLIFYTPYIIKISLVTFGEENKRLEQFKKQLADIYSNINEAMDIKTRHKDGFLEYTNGTGCYILVAYNQGYLNPVKRAQSVKEIIAEIGKHYEFDIRGYNTYIEDDLYRRYEGVKLFCDPAAAKDYLAMIDFNRKLAAEKTLMMINVFVVYGRLSEYIEMKEMLNNIVKSPQAKAFRSIKIADADMIDYILSEDIDTYVSIEEMQRDKYVSGHFFGSEVVEYDTSPNQEVDRGIESEYERGFMIKDE